jgi:hypothetical protein
MMITPPLWKRREGVLPRSVGKDIKVATAKKRIKSELLVITPIIFSGKGNSSFPLAPILSNGGQRGDFNIPLVYE